MNLLDRYIARQYFINIVALLVILFCFIVTIDVSLNLPRYWRVAEEITRASGQPDTSFRKVLVTAFDVIDIWWPRLLSLFNFMLGLVLIGAMGFTCTQLVRQRELVAMLASGQSLYRVARPILIVALGMTTLQVLNQEFVIPRIAPLLTRDQGDAGKRDMGTTRVPPTVDGQDRIFYAATFDADKGELTDLSVWERNEQGLATRRIHAAHARWRDGAWQLEDATSELRGGAAHRSEPAPTRIETDLDPTVLKIRRYSGFGQNLSLRQAHEILSRMDAQGLGTDQARRNHDQIMRTSVGRISTMLSNLLTLCIAMSFFLTRVPGNMVFQALKCAPIGIVSLVGGVLGTAVAIPRVPPQVSVFLPVMILFPVAIALISRVRS
jgi:lipopolysaccharide export system permease protein